jgi:hypothetical protein
MKNTLIWIKSNLALALFLFLQFFALAAGLVWTASTGLKQFGFNSNDEPLNSYIYVEQDLAEALELPFSEVKETLTKDEHIFMMKGSDSLAYQKLLRHKVNTIILDRHLTHAEVKTLPENFTPLVQQESVVQIGDELKNIVIISNKDIIKSEKILIQILTSQDPDMVAKRTTTKKNTQAG